MIDAERTFKCKWPKVKFNEISGLLQFYLIICSQECYWISWRDFQNAVKCNYLLIIDMIVLENTFLKNQISNNVTFLSFLCNQRTFWTFADASFSLKLIYIFPENLNSLSENWSFWNNCFSQFFQCPQHCLIFVNMSNYNAPQNLIGGTQVKT